MNLKELNVLMRLLKEMKKCQIWNIKDSQIPEQMTPKIENPLIIRRLSYFLFCDAALFTTPEIQVYPDFRR